MLGRFRKDWDPFWDDGVLARRAHQRMQVEAVIAMVLSLVACGVTAAMWLRELAPLAQGILPS